MIRPSLWSMMQFGAWFAICEAVIVVPLACLVRRLVLRG